MTPMQVRRAGRWLGFTVLTAALIHVASVWLLPQLTAKSALDQVRDAAGFNQILHLTDAGEKTLSIPRPDPSSLESLCAFDIERGAVQVVVPAGAQRTTVSIVANNTVPIYAASMIGTGRTVVIATPEQAARLEGDIAVSPSETGLILVRVLSFDPSSREQAEAVQRGVTCGYAG